MSEDDAQVLRPLQAAMSDSAPADDFDAAFFLAYARDEQFIAFWRSKHGDASYVEWNRTATNEELAALFGEWATLAARSELTPWEGSAHEDVAFQIARDAATMGRLALGHTREWSADDPTTWRIDRYWGIHDSSHDQNGPCPERYREVAEIYGEEAIVWISEQESSDALYAHALAAAHYARLHLGLADEP